MRRYLLFAAVCLIVTFAYDAARAQTEDDSVRYVIDPVTITGTRVRHSWIQVPLSLTIIGTKELRKSKGYGLDEILTFVPGVLAQSRFEPGRAPDHSRFRRQGAGALQLEPRAVSGCSITDSRRPNRTGAPRSTLWTSRAGGVEVMRSNASSLYGNAEAASSIFRRIPHSSGLTRSTVSRSGVSGSTRNT